MTVTFYRLLEVDGDLQKAIEGNEELVIKGEPEEEIAIVSGERTWLVREILTSNDHLLYCTKSASDIGARSKTLLEAVRVPGRLGRLRAYLKDEALYPGPEEFCWTEEQAEQTVQASIREIRSCFEREGAFILDGRIRTVSDALVEQVLKTLFATVDLDDGVHNLSSGLMAGDSRDLGELGAVRKEAIDHVLKMYVNQGEVDRVKVLRFYAETLFKQKEIWNKEQFEQRWLSLLPLSFSEPNLAETLRGLAISSQSGRELHYFAASALPTDADALFRTLFQERNRWSLTEMQPYVEAMAEKEGLKPLDLIIKYARVSTSLSDTTQVTPVFNVEH